MSRSFLHDNPEARATIAAAMTPAGETPVRQRTTDNRTLDERLKAARSTLRFQDRRVADVEGRLTEPGPPT